MITLSTWGTGRNDRRNYNYNSMGKWSVSPMNISSDLLGLCTEGQSRTVGWGCTCPPSLVTSSWSWSPARCSPCEDPRRSVCLRCRTRGCWRWSSPAQRAPVWTRPGRHEARRAARLTICRSQRDKVPSAFSTIKKGLNTEGGLLKVVLTCLKPEASWTWWGRSERWSRCTPSWCPGSSRSSDPQRCGRACCCLFRIIR